MSSSSIRSIQSEKEYIDSINATQIEELKQQFHVYDVNGSGYIEHDDMKIALINIAKNKNKTTTNGKGISQHVTDNEVTELIKQVDYDNDGKLNFEEFISWNRQCFINQMTIDFQKIDIDSNGYLTKNEIKQWLLQLKKDGITENYNDENIKISEEELDDLCYELDINGNGRISLNEFIYGMAAVKAGDSYYVINGEMYISKLTEEFKDLDTDDNGYIDEKDFKLNAQKLNLGNYLSQKEFEDGLKYMDSNNDGKISLNEFIAAIVSSWCLFVCLVVASVFAAVVRASSSCMLLFVLFRFVSFSRLSHLPHQCDPGSFFIVYLSHSR